jgi:hypothetical protein
MTLMANARWRYVEVKEDTAQSLATAYLKSEGKTHCGISGYRFLQASALNQLYGFEKFKEDYYVVDFHKPLGKDVLVQSPCVISVMVYVRSGMCCELPTP